jgi:NAD(P)-dependent dehydrogenase (short-subunit alcohol dehydrogenase family)
MQSGYMIIFQKELRYILVKILKINSLIVNISSISELIGMAGAGAYTASKGAVRSITKAAEVDGGVTAK